MTFRFAIRNLTKRPFLNSIKIIGLSLSLSSILLIVLFIKNELSYDHFHSKSERIYRLTITDENSFNGKHFARIYNPDYLPNMVEYFPEIENYVRLVPVLGGAVKVNENFITITQAFQCDSTFFDIFDSILLVGNQGTVLNQPGSMVISETFAKKVFGVSNPVGQIVKLPSGQYYGEDMDFLVRGIMKDFPQNAHFHPEFIVTPKDRNELKRWAWTYLLLKNSADYSNISASFKDFYAIHTGKSSEETKVSAYLQNISDIHLHSKKFREIETNSNVFVIYTLSLATLILLFVGLFNYSNLNIGMSDFSDKFLFVSKVSGSSKKMRLRYFLLEWIIILAATLICTAVIVFLGHKVILKNYSLNLFENNISTISIIIFVYLLLSLVFGILPIFKHVLSSVRTTLFKSNKTGKESINKSLVVFQYAISVALIVAVIVIRQQTSFALNKGIGVNSNNVICFTNVHSNIQKKFTVFKEELLKYNSIKSVTAMLEPPGGEANDKFRFTMEDYVADESKNAQDFIGVFPCDYSFINTLDLEILSGTNFSETFEDNEGSGEYIINESAMKRLNYINPDKIIGKKFQLFFHSDAVKIPSGQIIGVVKDFHLSTVKREVEPLVMFKRKDLWLLDYIISFQSGMQTKAISDIKDVWMKMFPEYPFEYHYVDALYKQVYKSEMLQTKLLTIFSFIALFISSMGLLGLSLLTNQRRTKEIGIRKVNGAKTGEVMTMLNENFMKLVLLSFIIAMPFVYFAMDKWLANFAYRINISWWMFAIAGLIVLITTVLTVSINSFRIAARNPVEALKYE